MKKKGSIIRKQTAPPPGPASAVAGFVGEVMSTVRAPIDAANLAIARATLGLLEILPKMPAARLYSDLVFQFGHSHPHPPTFGFPVPSTGPLLASGCMSVLINGQPAARNGDMGLAVWCGGYFPIFELITGSSHVFIGGARAARTTMDITLHCLPDPLGGKWGLNKIGIAMAAFGAGMSVVTALAASEQENADQKAAAKAKADSSMAAKYADQMAADGSISKQEVADAQADAAIAAAEAESAAASAVAAGVGAATAAAQAAADIAAIAMGLLMGKDPGVGFPLGMVITGSPNVLIGGFPMPGWDLILKGLFKLLRPVIRRIQLKLPQGRLRRAACALTGHPVDVASGRLVTATTDFEIEGRVPIIFERSYDSASTDYEGPLGWGWTHPYDQHIWESDRFNCLIWRDREGRQVRLDKIGIGEKYFQPLERVWLTRTASGRYELTDLGDGLTYEFGRTVDDDRPFTSESNALQLLGIRDRNDNRIELKYEGRSLVEIANGSGVFVSLHYHEFAGRSRIAEIRQHLRNGRDINLIKYGYNEEAELISAFDRTYTPLMYAYSDHLLTKETNRNGLSFYFEYEGDGPNARCIHTWGDEGIYERRLTYAPRARITRVADGLGGVTVYHYNDLDLVTKIFDAEGGVVQWEYGPVGETVHEIDEVGRLTAYAYDTQLNVTSVTSPDGTQRSVEFNDISLPLIIKDESGAEWRQEYDARGNVTATINPLDARRGYEYNGFGDVVTYRNALGNETKFTWTASGQLETVILPGGRKIAYVYNDNGLPVEIGDVTAGSTHLFEYDDAERIKRITELDARRQTIGVQRYEYDPQGNLTKYSDPNGNSLTYIYTGYDKLAQRIDSLGFIRRFDFDTEERLTSITNENGDVYVLKYDLEGNVIEETGFDGRTKVYRHNAAGDLVYQKDPLGREFFYRLDSQGRVTARVRNDGSQVSYEYDACGRLVKAASKESEVRFEYDRAWQILSETQNGRVVGYEYDAEAQRTRRYVTGGGVTSNEILYGYDADGNLADVEIGGRKVSYERDTSGRLIGRTMPNGVYERQEFGMDGRLALQTVAPGRSRPPFISRHLQWDRLENLISIDDSVKGRRAYGRDPMERLNHVERSISSIGPEPRNSTDHDSKSSLPKDKRLWQADDLHGREITRVQETEELNYDGNGNLTRRSSNLKGIEKFEYGSGDRLIRHNNSERTFDAAGNLTRKRFADGREVSYEYDADNQLIAVSSLEGGRITFKYDPFGRRIAKISDSGETGFIWDGDVVLGEYTLGDRLVEYVHDGFVPLVQITDEEIASYHTDYLGTPREMTNGKGALSWQGSYDEFGRVTSVSGEAKQNIRFQGQYEDSETGLYYNRYRYYDPDDCCYLTKDPIGLLGGWNFYANVHDPTEYIDPLGLKWEPGTPKPKGWRLPKNGTWSGEKGHSDFTPRNPKALGINPGDKIPFRNGMPDFSAWSQRNLRVAGMTGVHETDMPLIHDHLARQMGLANQTAAKTWLSKQKLTPHHAGGSKVILVPMALHDGVRHMGGASELRSTPKKKKKKTC